MVLCCLVPLVLLSVGTAGLAALIAGNAWWLGLAALALAFGVAIARMRRPLRGRDRPETCQKGSANE